MKKLRGALVGYGFIMERGHAAAYRQRAGAGGDVEIVAIADISEPRRELARSHFPTARLYADHGARSWRPRRGPAASTSSTSPRRPATTPP